MLRRMRNLVGRIPLLWTAEYRTSWIEGGCESWGRKQPRGPLWSTLLGCWKQYVGLLSPAANSRQLDVDFCDQVSIASFSFGGSFGAAVAGHLRDEKVHHAA
jgi:hypothetical protein